MCHAMKLFSRQIDSREKKTFIYKPKKMNLINGQSNNVRILYSNSFKKRYAAFRKNSRGGYFTILITSYLRQPILCNIILFYGKTLKRLLQSTYIVFYITATLHLFTAHAFYDARPFSLKSRVSLGSHT